MERTERFYKIDRLLRENRFVTIERFLDELSVSRATFKRDIEYMRDRLNAPIRWDRENGGYHFDKIDGNAPSYELPGIWFNQSEIFALLSMESLLTQIQPGLLGSRLEPLREKLNDIVSVGDFSMDSIKDRIKILNVASRTRQIKYFDVIALGLMRGKQLAIEYFVRARNELTQRDISPQRIVYYRDNWYVDGWCHRAESIRSFSLDAIKNAEVLPDDVIKREPRELDEVLGSGYGIFSGVDVQWATLKFNPERSKWVVNEEWHPDQRIRTTNSGELILELPYSAPHELVMDIMKYGADVEVISPQSLRELIKEKFASGLAKYQ
jgi:predicted DNA-binding transcriptional regulator YafY